MPLAMEAWNLKHWTSREAPLFVLLKMRFQRPRPRVDVEKIVMVNVSCTGKASRDGCR